MKKLLLLSALFFVVSNLKAQEQKDSLLIPKSNCLPDDEEIEVFLKKEEMFGLYAYLMQGFPESFDPPFYPLSREVLMKWLPSDTGRALIAKLSPKGNDTLLFTHNRSRVPIGDSSWSICYPWTHTPLKRRERKEAKKEVMVSLTGHELLALFHLFAFNDAYYRPRLFKVIRQNYCTYASYSEVREWVKFYKGYYYDYPQYFLRL